MIPSRNAIGILFLALLLSVKSARAAADGGFDHRAHAVTGKDKLVYDVDDNGTEEVTLNGSGSHSHYFDAGPPIVSGVITSYSWEDVDTGEVVCTLQMCAVTFSIGETTLKLTVMDNTGDSAEDLIRINVRPKSEATSTPRIDKISPERGPADGGNFVTIIGDFLYADSEVFFGDAPAENVKHVDIKTIVVTAPSGDGNQDIKVVSAIGESNGEEYEYQADGAVPIDFELKTLTKPDGSIWNVFSVTCITIGKDHRYYMGSQSGFVMTASVNRDLVVTESCQGAEMGENRTITGIGFNPLDPKNRVFVSTNTHFWKKHGETWNNAKIEVVYPDADGCPVRGETIISGLPVSNGDHGVNSITFNLDGKMLIAIGASSNAGASTPKDRSGGVPESPLTAAIIEADYLRPGFNGNIQYDVEDPATAKVVSGDVIVFAHGFRNCFGMVVHANGEIYITDNGPNRKFGLTSTSCTTADPGTETEDKLVRLVRGQYYGHPNRNRGRFDARQCVYKHPWEPSGDGYMEPMGWMESSTDGIIDYRANSFQGTIRGDLFLSKASFGRSGLLYRAELSDNGQWLEAGPYDFLPHSGLSLTMGLHGELIIPQLRKNKVLAYQPQEDAPPVGPRLLNVYPSRGPSQGGNEIIVTGHNLNVEGTVVLVGARQCSNFRQVQQYSLKCTVPPGHGKLQVRIVQDEYYSTGYGHDYEYIGPRSATAEGNGPEDSPCDPENGVFTGGMHSACTSTTSILPSPEIPEPTSPSASQENI